MGWDWSSFFGTALGCALGWYIFPRIGAWVKFKRGLKRNPAGRQANCRQKQRGSGLFMPETRVAFFGTPAVGTHLMLECPEVALELPLRMVVSDVPGQGTVLFMPDVLWLAQRYGINPQLESLRKMLGFMALLSDRVCGA